MPDPKLASPKRCTKIVFGPSVLIIASNESSNPRMIDVIPTIDVMPMTTPRTVSADRILLARIVPSAITIVSSEERDTDRARLLFLPKRFDRVQRAARIAG